MGNFFNTLNFVGVHFFAEHRALASRVTKGLDAQAGITAHSEFGYCERTGRRLAARKPKNIIDVSGASD